MYYMYNYDKMKINVLNYISHYLGNIQFVHACVISFYVNPNVE